MVLPHDPSTRLSVAERGLRGRSRGLCGASEGERCVSTRILGRRRVTPADRSCTTQSIPGFPKFSRQAALPENLAVLPAGHEREIPYSSAASRSACSRAFCVYAHRQHSRRRPRASLSILSTPASPAEYLNFSRNWLKSRRGLDISHGFYSTRWSFC